MRLPRRMPWASLAELDQVCSWIYTDENDLETKVLALQRMSAWRAITALPHALESTLSILTIIVQDTANEGPSSYLLVRQAYAAALIRLVNGLVDPLQLGAYARSIASIATQLGLPAWLVELRHAATHEDLPSLEVLRQASRDAMIWLLNNYWIPTLNPSISTETQKAPLRPLAPLLTQYKTLLKTTTRDASLRTQYKADTTKILRDIERWIAEAKVGADVSTSALDWDPDQDEEGTGDDSRERWALDRLSDGLLEKGGLVPLSKRKRSVNNTPFQPSAAALAIWTPLLEHLHMLHPSLPSVLVANAVRILLSAQEEPVSTVEVDTISFADAEAGRARDPSYDMCLAGWVFWIATELDDGSGSSDVDSRVEEAVVTLITGLGPMSRTSDTQAAHHLLNAFTNKYPKLKESTQLLLSTTPSNGTSNWSEADLDTMSERLSALMAARQNSAGNEDAGPQASVESREADGVQLPVGWRKLSVRDGWRPTPIGVYVACH